MKKVLMLFFISMFIVAGCDSSDNKAGGSDNTVLKIEQIGRYKTGAPFDEGGAEIAAFDPATRMLFSTNGDTKVIDIINLSNPENPAKAGVIDPSDDWGGFGGVTSVNVNNGILAIAAEHDDDGGTGKVMFYTTAGTYKGAIDAGILPDMLLFSPDGTKIVVANEGEPYVNGSNQIVDPEGSVSIITVDYENLNNSSIDTVRFTGVTASALTHLRTPLQTTLAGSTVLLNKDEHRDFEPEYITISDDSNTAYVSLQENNGIAVIDITSKTLTAVYGLGYKDHSIAGNGVDAKEDGSANIETVNLRSLYMPDTLASYIVNGSTYILSANEGDSRKLEDSNDDVIYTDNSDDSDGNEIDDITTTSINAVDFPGLEFLIDQGTTDNVNYESLYLMGGRSFSIWKSSDFSSPVFDSGDDFETIIADAFPAYFNAADDDNDIDSRSPKSGPEPEALAIGKIGDRVLAFIGLEKFGGIVVYDITDPETVVYKRYITNRDFSVDPDELKDNSGLDPASAGDIAPEGMLFVPAANSPNGENMLIVSNEVSGTITIYTVKY